MGWIKSDGNLADGLTKMNKLDLVQHVDQYIIPPPMDKTFPVESHNFSLIDGTIARPVQSKNWKD